MLSSMFLTNFFTATTRRLLYYYIPAICCARRIFCRLFQQQTEHITMSKNSTKVPNAIPTFAPAVRCGPHEGSPGIPQRPPLSVKLCRQKSCKWSSATNVFQ
ncbi:hypothetical protein PanWU01x14_316910 [Parasponia andersonii]|uniref:Uncharacterized protein n=1 Tax=Parasponia andersonii TaxID=3476 RepID=A0A2P5AMX9_PARAD|nr:hypothetical protein PanWU01x14_316910 [Parasponia andersonii]